MTSITTKKCKICKVEKSLEEFRPQAKGKLGRKSYCIPCDNEYNRRLYEKDREFKKMQSEVWNSKNPDKVKEYQENHQKKLKNLNNPEKIEKNIDF